MSLKQKASKGIFWSLIDTMGNQGIHFTIGIILARLLSPEEYGIVGLITVILTFMLPFVDGGFGEALIRKKDCRNEDLSTVFVFNIFLSFFLYIVLFLAAGSIADFYNHPELKPLVRVLALVLIISGFSLIQQTLRTKRVDFKLQTKISVISSLSSGIIAIFMAYYGFGVWSLVFRFLLLRLFNCILLWYWNNWRPSFIFRMKSFRELFSFGSKLFAASLIRELHKNLVYFIIGKFQSATQLGYYTRADMFQRPLTLVLMGTLSRVTFPVLSQIQDDNIRLRKSFEMTLVAIMFVSVPLVLLLAAISQPLTLFLIGEKWLVASVYLQLLCFSAIWVPMQSINLDVLKVKGKTGLLLRLEIIKVIINALIVLTILVWDIQTMLVIKAIAIIFTLYIDSYFNKRLINFSYFSQMRSVAATVLISLSMFAAVYGLSLIVPPMRQAFVLGILVPSGIIYYLIASYLFQRQRLFDVIEILRTMLKKEKADPMESNAS